MNKINKFIIAVYCTILRKMDGTALCAPSNIDMERALNHTKNSSQDLSNKAVAEGG